jgi:cytochrome c biogenesis protein CcmG/thiol:disulfide interchange protein DsbE
VDERLIPNEDSEAAVADHSGVEAAASSGDIDATATAEPRSPLMYGLKLVAVAAVVGLLVLLVWATLAAGRGSSLVARIAAGKKPAAPGFNLGVIWPHTETWPPELAAAAGDGKLDLRELRGHPVVLNFWASWCIPCREEAPILHAAAARHRGQVVFVGVDVKDLTDDALAFARKYQVNYVSARDGSGDKTWSRYGLTGVPETYFIDASGRIVAHIPGAVSARTLEEGLATITGASGGGTLPGGAHVTP